MDFIKEWGLIAGIAGLGLGVFLILFKEVIRKNIFPMLTKKHGFQVIVIFMLLVWSIAAFSMYIYFKEPDNASEPITWNDKRDKYLNLIKIVGKVSANSESVSSLAKLKLEFAERYEGDMTYATINERELLKRLMILNKDLNNTINNRTDFYKRDKLKQSSKKLIEQLHATITKGDSEN